MSTHEHYRSQVDSSTSAWFKTVLDPAHARDYGCAGIPDENKMPSLICCGRTTITVVPTDVGKASAWVKVSDGAKVSPTTDPVVNAVTVLSPGSAFGFYVLYYASYSGDDVVTIKWSSMPEALAATTDAGKLVEANAVIKPTRYVAGSLTADIVGQLMYTGGYFESGYLPPSARSNSDGFVYPLTGESQWATRTCNYKDGSYIVHRLSNYDWARIWRTEAESHTLWFKHTNGSVNTSNKYITDLADPGNTINNGYDALFVKYYVSGSTNWVLRVTYNAVWESQTPYSSGGTDGAKYDPAAIQAYLTIADSVDFVYPASYNDLKKLIGSIRGALVKAKKPLKAVISTMPYGGAVNAALDLLLDAPASNRRRRGNKPKKKPAKRVIFKPLPPIKAKPYSASAASRARSR